MIYAFVMYSFFSRKRDVEDLQTKNKEIIKYIDMRLSFETECCKVQSIKPGASYL